MFNMVTAEEALKSCDPKEVKRLRSSISAQVTCDINILQKELNKKQEDKYEYDKISPHLIKTQKKKLVGHFDLLLKLHERFCEVRDEGSDDDGETNLIEADTQFISTITSKVCPLLDSIGQYEEGFNKLAKCKTMLESEVEVRNSVAKAKKDFKVVHDKIKEEINEIELCADEDKQSKLIKMLPTESFLKDLSTSFNGVKKFCSKLKEIYQTAEKFGDESKLEAEYDVEYSDYFSLDTKLRKYEQAKSFCSTKSYSMKTGGDSEKYEPLKINKPEALKFSGEAREFASFKRDFMAIVVPHRSNAQIGMHFRQAIPEKHKHLISNKDLEEWESMMTIIEEELANPKLIVDLTVGEIERLKTATSDKSFIEFVENIEKIERDLNTLSQLSEIANSSVLSKLESKLPTQINHDWAEKVIKETLFKKTSEEKFEAFMQFLKDAKDMTKYSQSLPTNIGKSNCFVTGTVTNQNRELKD